MVPGTSMEVPIHSPSKRNPSKIAWNSCWWRNSKKNIPQVMHFSWIFLAKSHDFHMIHGEIPISYPHEITPFLLVKHPWNPPRSRRYILSLFPDAQIAVTQPRRMAAVNLAKRMAKVRWGGWRYLQFRTMWMDVFFLKWDLRGFKADLMDVNGFIADLMDVNECQRTIYGILMVLNGDLMEI